MADRLVSVDSASFQFPEAVREALAANLADPGTPEGEAVAIQKVYMFPETYGALGGGVDDTVAFQTMIDAAPATGAVFWLSKVYTVLGVDGHNKSNLTFDGIRGVAGLQYKTSVPGGLMLTWNPSTKPTFNAHHLTFRNLTFMGLAAGVSEHRALLHFSAVDDVLIEDCTFKQFQGDAIYIGRTAVGGTDIPIVNKRWKIVNNYFDGIDYENRNAISVIACDDLLIHCNSFARVSHSTMPGAIDIEPNDFDTTASITDVVITGNVFKDCGGNAADIGVSLVSAASIAKRWEISGNTHSGSRASAVKLERYNRAALDADPDAEINVHDNIIGTPAGTSTLAAIIIRGLRGVDVERNKITGWPAGALAMGQNAASKVLDIGFRGNKIHECGGGGGSSYVVFFGYASRVALNDNEVRKTGTALDAAIVAGSTGISSDVVMRDNNMRGANELLFKFAGHATTTATNWALGNISSGSAAPAAFFGHISTPA